MSVDALFKQANAAQRAGNWAEAERRYRALTRLKPLWAYHNLGVVYQTTGRFKEAETAFRTALRADPASAATRHSLAMLALGAGDYPEGWPLFEARRGVPELRIPKPNAPYPEWQGEDLSGKHLVVVKEQGLGDQIMLARFIPLLAARGARVTLICDSRLARLFAGLGAEILGADQAFAMPSADYWVLAFSLPLRLGITLETLPNQPYLSASPGGSAGGIGVVTRGSATHVNDRNRTPGPDIAARLLALGRSLAPEDTGAKDFQDTAEIIAGLDLVISVDTSVVHLAGAMGKPVWVLLTAADTDWRWLRGRSDSPWYPSVRLFRQPVPGKWSPVMRDIEAELAATPR